MRSLQGNKTDPNAIEHFRTFLKILSPPPPPLSHLDKGVFESTWQRSRSFLRTLPPPFISQNPNPQFEYLSQRANIDFVTLTLEVNPSPPPSKPSHDFKSADGFKSEELSCGPLVVFQGTVVFLLIVFLLPVNYDQLYGEQQ